MEITVSFSPCMVIVDRELMGAGVWAVGVGIVLRQVGLQMLRAILLADVQPRVGRCDLLVVGGRKCECR